MSIEEIDNKKKKTIENGRSIKQDLLFLFSFFLGRDFNVYLNTGRRTIRRIFQV